MTEREDRLTCGRRSTRRTNTEGFAEVLKPAITSSSRLPLDQCSEEYGGIEYGGLPVELPTFEGKLATAGVGVRDTEPVRERGQRFVV